MKQLVSEVREKLSGSKKLGGFFIGEKVIFAASFEKFVYVAGDFVTASRLKRGLEVLGKKVEIVSCGRENEDERDVNLFPFALSITKFFAGKLDGLVFLPSSISTKFDAEFLKQKLVLSLGQEISLDSLCQKLSDFGFERVEYVSAPFQFAVRGDIVDIFIEGDNPSRVEFFDEEIERIVNFDFSTMKTTQNIQSLEICPVLLKFGKDSAFELCENIIVDEPIKTENECALLKRSREEMTFSRKDLFLDFEDVPLDNFFVLSNTQGSEFENKTIGQKSYVTDFIALKNDVTQFVKSGQYVFLFGGKFFEILQEFLMTNKIAYLLYDEIKDKDDKKFKPTVILCKDYFPYSFSFLDFHILAIGTDDLYKNREVMMRTGRQSFSYLPKVGDFVVHSFYGIGRCKDIVRLKLSHFEKDYFVLEYKNGAILYLPSEQANLLSAYVGGEDPKLNALGSSEWTKLKEKVKENLKEVAISLAKIYKERASKKGFKFSRDEDLEQQFANAFEFELTPDQAQAIMDVDKDMESDKIMDRLICGDVGFGKTEVAFRAMFKAAYNGKQVAFLCPTTILCEQHFRNTKLRMKPFGLRVEVLNRFKTEKETNDILQRLAEGKIDILVGTHKMLGEKVRFKDLGLLVLDEEQRFGVKDKEKIKKIKSDIDVLTLSATPIPRTLHMSLSGIRDISVIATAPRERLPIQTYVSPYSDSLLQDVSMRELSRHGKVLILFNRVAQIYEFRQHVASLLPKARIGVAHGQMEEKELASVIDRLYNDEFDVFISTTLIENGIDLPALNTLFVVDCDMLGLSQLYQIRGRIGRSDKLAYAYLTFDNGKILTEEAYKRLEAIKEFRELGSGFKIAIRDLEIRGAGNILGKEQHGHMQKVGYDMYVKLLEEVTKEATGQSTQNDKEIKMEIMLDAFISENYLSSQEERIVFYDKISKISTEEELLQVKGELQSLAGDLPKEVENLCDIAYLKNMASQFNVKKIVVSNTDCEIYLYKTAQIIDKRLSKIISFYDTRLKFDDLPIIKVNSKGKVRAKLELLLEIFKLALKENL